MTRGGAVPPQRDYAAWLLCNIILYVAAVLSFWLAELTCRRASRGPGDRPSPGLGRPCFCLVASVAMRKGTGEARAILLCHLLCQQGAAVGSGRAGIGREHSSVPTNSKKLSRAQATYRYFRFMRDFLQR